MHVYVSEHVCHTLLFTYSDKSCISKFVNVPNNLLCCERLLARVEFTIILLSFCHNSTNKNPYRLHYRQWLKDKVSFVSPCETLSNTSLQVLNIMNISSQHCQPKNRLWPPYETPLTMEATLCQYWQRNISRKSNQSFILLTVRSRYKYNRNDREKQK